MEGINFSQPIVDLSEFACPAEFLTNKIIKIMERDFLSTQELSSLLLSFFLRSVLSGWLSRQRMSMTQ